MFSVKAGAKPTFHLAFSTLTELTDHSWLGVGAHAFKCGKQMDLRNLSGSLTQDPNLPQAFSALSNLWFSKYRVQNPRHAG
ncbi:hypothetical protein I79_024342 [Cricetulus griseus]|uniref:Uncharacterized protein n=1 Tax=Cricetulus griseus TaxID=10029 RepID=G3IKE1_CRIGR|nr:hypothetical protein I79_024342 [Cricetulus griseus]